MVGLNPRMARRRRAAAFVCRGSIFEHVLVSIRFIRLGGRRIPGGQPLASLFTAGRTDEFFATLDAPSEIGRLEREDASLLKRLEL